MLMIISYHYCYHGPVKIIDLDFGVLKVLMQCFTLGELGVTLFVLITGFYLVDREFSAKHMVKTIITVWMYSFGMYIGLCSIGWAEFTPYNLISSLFPILFKKYWFATDYVILMLLAPFLNIFVNRSSKRSLCTGTIMLFVIWTVLPTFLGIDLYGSVVILFVLIYLVGAVIKRLDISQKISVAKLRFIMAAAWLVAFVHCMIIDNLDFSTGILSYWQDWAIRRQKCFLDLDSSFTLVIAACIFMLFLKKKAFTDRFINMVGACIFGVYLLHDNDFIRGILWYTLDNSRFVDSPIRFVLYMAICTVAIFVAGVIVERCRQMVFNPIWKLIEKNGAWNKILLWMQQ